MIDKLLQEHMDQLDGDFVVSIAAHDFIQSCRRDYPDELDTWLMACAEEYVQVRMRRLLHAKRIRARRLVPIAAYREAMDAHAADEDGEGRQALEQYLAINEDNVWRRLREMTGDDLGYVATQYERRGRRELMWAAYFRALQRKIKPGQTVGDVLTEEQVVELQERMIHGDDT